MLLLTKMILLLLVILKLFCVIYPAYLTARVMATGGDITVRTAKIWSVLTEYSLCV